ncbi:hypothetical protein BDF22DRAFT_772480 [Syncephalis plumigaleata]|nr:hypothetical protein BDF22DRAFT_772480 [Syncephalis plumigaleata]
MNSFRLSSCLLVNTRISSVAPLSYRQWPINCCCLSTSSIIYSRDQPRTPSKKSDIYKRKNDVASINRSLSTTMREQKHMRTPPKKNDSNKRKNDVASVNRSLSTTMREQKHIRTPKKNDSNKHKDIAIPFSRTKKQQPNYFKDPYLLTDKLNRLYKAGKLEEALELLKETPIKAQSPVVWNELIQAYGRAGQGKNAWHAYNQMKKRGFKPTGQTFTNLLNAFARSQNVNIALTDTVLRSITDATSAASSIEDVYGRLSQIHLNVAIKVYAKAAHTNRLDQIVRVLRERQRMDSVAASTLIAAFARMDEFDRAWDIWKNDVRIGGIPVDSVLIGSILLACSRVTIKDAQHRAFFIADHYLGLGDEQQQQQQSLSSDNENATTTTTATTNDDDAHRYLAPTPANMNLLMLCCARMQQPKRGYQYFCRALDKYASTGVYQPDLPNFLSATGLLVSDIKRIRDKLDDQYVTSDNSKSSQFHHKKQ